MISPRSWWVRCLVTLLYGSGAIRLLTVASRYLTLQGAGAPGYRRQPAFQILTYHRVNNDRDPLFPSVPTEVFEWQMAYIAGRHQVLPVEVLVERAVRGDLPRNALGITFDDGYRDTLTHAAPILAKYGLPATVFLTTGFIGGAEIPWFDRLALALRLSTAPTVTLPSGEALPLAGVSARVRALERLLRVLKGLADDDLRRTLDGVLGTLGVTDQRQLKDLMLSWDDVHALMGLGFTVGAHTVTHPILSRVSLRRAQREIDGSRAMIQSACGMTPRAFAYPNGGPGDYTETVTRLVRQAGFTCAVTTRFGVNTRDTSPWELRRGGPWEQHLPTYALKLAWYRLRGA